MAKPDVFARVKVDLALGHTHVARQRLRTLLATDPNDLDVREALASVYRQTGNLVEAGRWYFLSPQLRAQEAIAFERAHPSPWLRLRTLRFTGDIGVLSPVARQRLMALQAEAERVGPPPIWRGEPVGEAARQRPATFPCLFVAITLVVLGALVAIGVYRAVLWLAHF